MRPKVSALFCPTQAAAPVSQALLATVVLAASVLVGGCPRIIGRKAPAAAKAAPSPEAAQAGETPQTAEAPNVPAQPGYSSIYCSGFTRNKRLSEEIRLISGEQASYKIVFLRGEYVYINRGANKGVRVGDRFMVVREESDPALTEWFKGQEHLAAAMGTRYRDAGQLRVVNVQPKVSIAEVSFSCDYMQRGDIVRPFEERPAPPFKDGAFDHFAPVSGKPVGMIVTSRDFEQGPATNTIVYVNLGAAQGVKIGDYLRIFRYEGKWNENIPVIKGYQYEMYGFGSNPRRYSWNDLPREVLGEGIVLNASRNASTVMITYTYNSIYAGDEVEIE